MLLFVFLPHSIVCPGVRYRHTQFQTESRQLWPWPLTKHPAGDVAIQQGSNSRGPDSHCPSLCITRATWMSPRTYLQLPTSTAPTSMTERSPGQQSAHTLCLPHQQEPADDTGVSRHAQNPCQPSENTHRDCCYHISGSSAHSDPRVPRIPWNSHWACR